MKVLILADNSSAHTIKWANILQSKGLQVFVWGFSGYTKVNFNKNVTVLTTVVNPPQYYSRKSSPRKIIYLKYFPDLLRIIKKYKPDILHAHYATSYGLLGLLTGFHPLIISVWGTNVYDFPNNSWMHRLLFKFIVSRADIVLSTSEVMKREVAKYYSKEVKVTPFGVDLNKFKSISSTEDTITIGTVKTLEKNYGINYLISAFKIVTDKFPKLPLKLLIVGGGSEEEALKKLTKDLSIDHLVEFTGYVAPNLVPKYQSKITIPVFLSIEESFGVSAVEAAACGKAVVATRVSGYSEIIEDQKTGLLVEPFSAESAARAIETLITNAKLREDMGIQALERVRRLYNLDDNADQMISIYQKVLDNNE